MADVMVNAMADVMVNAMADVMVDVMVVAMMEAIKRTPRPMLSPKGVNIRARVIMT